MKFIKHLIFLLLVLGIQPLFAQLSSKHYLPPLKKSGSSGEFAGQAYYLSTPETSAFDVNVYQGTNSTAVATISISNTSSGKYEPTLGIGGTVAYGSNNTSFVTDAYAGIVLSSAGFRFEAPSGKKFYVNWRASHSAQAASLVSAGEAGLGTDFKWGGSPLVSITSGNFAGSAYQYNVNSVIGIMATEDNTQVSISGYNPACTFTNASGQNGITADVINITLNAGQSYVLEARPTGLTSETSPNNDGWLGATISSNKKIALNQGHLLLSFNLGNLDMSMTQITPTSNIGKEYVFIRGLGGDKPEFPVIIATENNTEVYVNNETTPIATLNDGQWIKIPSSKYSQSGPTAGYQGANMYVRASKNVYAFQTLDAGFNYDSPANGDVFQVAPLNCLLDNGINNIANVIETGKASYNVLSTIYLMVMASSAINASDIVIKYGLGSVNTIPSSSLSTARKTVLGTSDWVTYFVEIPAPQGDISVYAPGPVAVAYLGYSGAVGVAGYFSGFGSIPIINVETTGNGCFPNTTLTATPGFTSYAWYKDGVLMPSVTTNTFTPNVAGDYYVVVYNGFCTYPSATKSVYDCNPEVIITNTASDNYLLPGETTTFTIKVKLLGGSAAQNLQISNLIPAHLTYTSSTVTKGTFSGSGSNYTWNVGTMTNGEENILRVTTTAQAVTSGFSESYITNNSQTFALGTEANNLVDDINENVIIYPGCSSSLAGTISGAASYCSSTNSTTLTVTDAVGDLQWQSSSDNINFTNISGATTTTLLVTNLASTTYYRVQTTVDTCVEYATSVSIAVSQGPAYTLTSALGTVSQTLCVNTNITPITYSTTNTTGVSFSGLPSGVTGAWTNDTVTISGSPSVTGTFNYSISLVGTCTVTISGTITIPNTINSITLTSASGTNAQSINSNVAITTITYATSGATGATISGLPLGVSGIWTNNTLTISGTPTLAGIYNYSISLTGGCGSASGSGTINVNGVSITSNITGSSTCAGASVTFTATAIGFTSPTYQWYKNGTAISGANASTYTTSVLVNNDVINVAVVEGGASVSTTGLVLNLDAGNSSSYNSGATTWTDLTGRGNDGTLNNVTYSSSNQGYLSFNGTSSYISLPNSTDFNFGTDDFTIELWAQNSSATNTPNLLAINSNNSFYSSVRIGWAPNINGNPTVTFAHSTNGTSWSIQTGYTGSFSSWTQIVLSRTAGIVTIYANGVNKGTYNLAGSLMTTTTSNPIYNQVGTLPNWQSVYTLLGNMSIVRYYKAAGLTSSQVISNYNAICSRYGLSAIGSTSNSITTTVTPGPTTPSITVVGDACINKTTLSTTSGLTSYSWYKDNVAISGATNNSYIPTAAGVYKVVVSNGTCNATSTATTISNCGVTADGSMSPTLTTLVSNEGGINFGTGINELGSLFNSTGLTTTTGAIAATTAVIGGIISATNAVTSSIGVIYSTDANFGTYSSSTIQSNVVSGTYTTTITGLTGVTTYYAKSFIVNKAGTSYGPVVSFTTPAPYVAPIITTTGLVLNLDAAHPDSYSGSGTAWSDVSGNNNSVTLPSILASSYSATTGGGSFTFNSNNPVNKFSSISINNWNINTTDAISVETWIKYTSNGGLQFYFQDDALNYRYGFDQNGHFYYDLGSHSDRNPSTATLTADTWHHLVITAGIESANGNRVKSRFYIDGAEVYSYDEGMSNLPNITTPYHFGDDPYHYYPLNANVGVIRVYNTALSQAEITLNFNAQKARFGL